MAVKVCNKLVRDGMPEIIMAKGEKPEVRTLSDNDYIKELKTKLQEEVNEFAADESIDELADIQEVIYGILFAKNKTFAELEELRKQKKQERGGFEKKVFLVSTESD